MSSKGRVRVRGSVTSSWSELGIEDTFPDSQLDFDKAKRHTLLDAIDPKYQTQSITQPVKHDLTNHSMRAIREAQELDLSISPRGLLAWTYGNLFKKLLGSLEQKSSLVLPPPQIPEPDLSVRIPDPPEASTSAIDSEYSESGESENFSDTAEDKQRAAKTGGAATLPLTVIVDTLKRSYPTLSNNPKEITTAMPPQYWAGRFMALQDRFHNELLESHRLARICGGQSAQPFNRHGYAHLLTTGENTIQELPSAATPSHSDGDGDGNGMKNAKACSAITVTASSICQEANTTTINQNTSLTTFTTAAAASASAAATAAAPIDGDDASRTHRVFVHLESLCTTDAARTSLRQWQAAYAHRLGTDGGLNRMEAKAKASSTEQKQKQKQEHEATGHGCVGASLYASVGVGR
ncbi:hypothetical protein VTG60DRAFT_4119 [Thermothelomyces hinnuleus]